MSGGVPKTPWADWPFGGSYKRSSTIPKPPVADTGYGWAFFLLGLVGFVMLWW